MRERKKKEKTLQNVNYGYLKKDDDDRDVEGKAKEIHGGGAGLFGDVEGAQSAHGRPKHPHAHLQRMSMRRCQHTCALGGRT